MRLRDAVGRPSMRDTRRGIPSKSALLLPRPLSLEPAQRLDSPENIRGVRKSQIFVSWISRDSCCVSQFYRSECCYEKGNNIPRRPAASRINDHEMLYFCYVDILATCTTSASKEKSHFLETRSESPQGVVRFKEQLGSRIRFAPDWTRPPDGSLGFRCRLLNRRVLIILSRGEDEITARLDLPHGPVIERVRINKDQNKVAAFKEARTVARVHSTAPLNSNYRRMDTRFFY